MSEEILRCAVTGNMSGTDTWAMGHPCPCPSCTAWVAANPVVEPYEPLRLKWDGSRLLVAEALREFAERLESEREAVAEELAQIEDAKRVTQETLRMEVRR